MVEALIGDVFEAMPDHAWGVEACADLKEYEPRAGLARLLQKLGHALRLLLKVVLHEPITATVHESYERGERERDKDKEASSLHLRTEHSSSLGRYTLGTLV